MPCCMKYKRKPLYAMHHTERGVRVGSLRIGTILTSFFKLPKPDSRLELGGGRC